MKTVTLPPSCHQHRNLQHSCQRTLKTQATQTLMCKHAVANVSTGGTQESLQQGTRGGSTLWRPGSDSSCKSPDIPETLGHAVFPHLSSPFALRLDYSAPCHYFDKLLTYWKVCSNCFRLLQKSKSLTQHSCLCHATVSARRGALETEQDSTENKHSVLLLNWTQLEHMGNPTKQERESRDLTDEVWGKK